jgi:hypothetical protein
MWRNFFKLKEQEESETDDRALDSLEAKAATAPINDAAARAERNLFISQGWQSLQRERVQESRPDTNPFASHVHANERAQQHRETNNQLNLGIPVGNDCMWLSQ